MGSAVACHPEWLQMTLSCQDGVHMKPGCETPLSKSWLRVLTEGHPLEAPEQVSPTSDDASTPGSSCDDRVPRADRERA